MSRRWLRERKRDKYYRLAKKLGYRARSAFKLIQLNEKYGIIKEGDDVLDLGAAPGGWLQVAREISKTGTIVGVDLKPIARLDGVITIVGDITKEETVEKIRRVKDRFDVVLSDVSPNISGVWDIDHARSVELSRRAFELARIFLKPGGNFLVKVFQGPLVEDLYNEIRKHFRFCKITKPRASRKESAEVYIIGKGFLG